jgi:signal peptidase I
MKKNKLMFNIYIIEMLLFIYIIIFKTLILKSLTIYVDLFNILFFSILTLLSYFLFGISKKKNLINYNGIQTLIISFTIYFGVTYLLGLFFGFLTNAYSLKLINIIKNVTFSLIFYFLRELLRYSIAKKTNKRNLHGLIILTILLTILDIIMQLNTYNLTTGSEIFEFIEACVIPNLALNSILSYISYNFNYKLTLLFLLLYDIPKYFLPIFPDLGTYLKSILQIIFIFVCYYKLSILLEKYERKITIKENKYKPHLINILIVIILILVGLISGLFKYHLFAIGSNSMLPYFQRGDAVLIKKLSNDELNTIEKGNVIAFYYNNQIIVHRVISIEENNGKYKIKTKGDNNDSIDAWTISEKDIYGKVEYIIKYIGLPSVELNEFMNEKR